MSIDIAEPPPHAADSVDWDLSPRRLGASMRGLPRLDQLLVVWVGLFFVARLPGVAFASFAPRFALTLVLLPIGIVALARQFRAGDRAAIAAVTIVAVGVLSGLLASDPLLSIRGRFGSQMSVLYLAMLLAAWSVARGTTRRAWPLLIGTIVAGLGVNLVIGLFQLLFDIQGGPLGTFAGRASGYLGNAAYFGALMSGGAALCAWLWVHRNLRWAVAGTFAASIGASISNSRGAQIVLVVAVLVLAVRAARRAAWLAPAAAATGLVVGQALTRIAADRVVVERLSKGSDGRWEIWRYALDALLERPLRGWGYGAFRESVQGRFTESFAARPGSDARLQPWFDPHNTVVGVGVGLGVVGVVLLAVFVVTCARSARGPLAWMVAVVAATWLLQPMSVNTAPVAMVLLGAAMPTTVVRDRVATVATIVGIALGAYVLGANVIFDAALSGDDPDLAADVSQWWGPDPFVSFALAQEYLAAAEQDPSAFPNALDFAERTARVDEEFPRWWDELASLQLVARLDDDAGSSIERSLALQPNSLRPWRLVAIHADRVGDDERAAEAAARICALGGDCE